MILSVPRLQLLCFRGVQEFTADRPFLYLLTVRKIPLFIGIYGGSEYAKGCADRNAGPPDSMFWVKFRRDMLKLKNQTDDTHSHDSSSHDTPIHDTHTHHTPRETSV